jgi:hypothetical protein
MNSLAIAQPTTPAPTMQTSYVFIGSSPAIWKYCPGDPEMRTGTAASEHSHVYHHIE